VRVLQHFDPHFHSTRSGMVDVFEQHAPKQRSKVKEKVKEYDKERSKKKRKEEEQDFIIPEFQHNNRFWVPFLPTVVVLFALGGKVYPLSLIFVFYFVLFFFNCIHSVWGTVIVGLMIGYICDMLGTTVG